MLLRTPIARHAGVTLVPLAIALLLAPTSVRAACESLAIPAYFYPGPLWSQAISAAPRVRIMVMNPASGPGSSSNADYVAAVRSAQAAGIQVFGYVHTSYARRNAQDVRNEISRYITWYGVNGIFFDEVSSGTADIPYYKNVAAAVRTGPGRRVMLNPGTVPNEGYMSVGDIIVVFEGPYTSYTPLVLPAWISRYPATRFSHVVYETPASSMANAMNLSLQRNAGYVFVTDDIRPNPWDTLPSYWSQELSRLPAQCP